MEQRISQIRLMNIPPMGKASSIRGKFVGEGGRREMNWFDSVLWLMWCTFKLKEVLRKCAQEMVRGMLLRWDIRTIYQQVYNKNFKLFSWNKTALFLVSCSQTNIYRTPEWLVNFQLALFMKLYAPVPTNLLLSLNFVSKFPWYALQLAYEIWFWLRMDRISELPNWFWSARHPRH